MLLSIEFLAAKTDIDLSIRRLCQSSIQYAMLVELADKLYNP